MHVKTPTGWRLTAYVAPADPTGTRNVRAGIVFEPVLVALGTALCVRFGQHLNEFFQEDFTVVLLAIVRVP
jgi:hypothetical protein